MISIVIHYLIIIPQKKDVKRFFVQFGIFFKILFFELSTVDGFYVSLDGAKRLTALDES